MHKAGIVFAFFVVLLSGFAIYETAKFITIRNAWMEKVEKAEKSAFANVEELDTQKILLSTLEEELTRKQLLWGQQWDANTNVLDAGTGRLQVDLGTNQGLPTGPDGSQLPTLYAFRPTADGNEYVGAFKVTTANANQTAMQLVYPPRAGQVQSWGLNSGPQSWRFRTQIPGGLRTQFSDFQVQFAIADEKLQERKNYIVLQTEAAQKADEQLTQRMNELNGDPNAPAGIGDVFKDGLVATIQKEEKIRNAALVEIDRLRKELDKEWKEQKALETENASLAAKLPGAGAAENSTSSTATSDTDTIR